jgi:nitrogen fixation protein NifU and related proteins
MKYTAKLLQHFYHPNNVGYFAAKEANIGSSTVGSYENGALVHLQVKFKANIVAAARFKAYGNAAVIAACSFATQWVTGKHVSEALQLSAETICSELDIPNIKIHYALLVEDALKDALRQN